MVCWGHLPPSHIKTKGNNILKLTTMKKLSIFSSMLMAIAAFTACSTDRDENPVLTVPNSGSFELYAPGITSNTIDMDHSESMTFKANQPNYGYTAPIIYMMEFAASEDGNTWSSWQATETTNENCKAITVPIKEIAGAVTSGLIELGRAEVEFPLAASVKARVHAFLRGLEETTSTYSQEVKFNATTSFVMPPVEILKLYMVGALTNWNKTDAQKALFYPEGDDIYTYTTQFTNKANLKIWTLEDLLKENWDGAYGSKTDGCEDPSGEMVNEKAGAITAPSSEFYTFTFDKHHMTYEWKKLENQTPTEYEAMYVVGGFNEWPGDTGEEMTQVTPHNWYVKIKLTAATELKFRANHNWDVNWGYGSNKDWTPNADSFAKIGANGAGNIAVEAGTYHFYLNDITNQMLIIPDE